MSFFTVPYGCLRLGSRTGCVPIFAILVQTHRKQYKMLIHGNRPRNSLDSEKSWCEWTIKLRKTATFRGTEAVLTVILSVYSDQVFFTKIVLTPLTSSNVTLICSGSTANVSLTILYLNSAEKKFLKLNFTKLLQKERPLLFEGGLRKERINFQITQCHHPKSNSHEKFKLNYLCSLW